MPFQLTCPGCGAIHAVDEQYVGKMGKCNKCGTRILLQPQPIEKASAPPTPPAQAKSRRKDRPATDKQKAFALDLGIEFEEGISAKRLSQLIDAALAYEEAVDSGQVEVQLKTLRKCEPSDMVEALRNRGESAILVHWDSAAASSEEDFGGGISFSDNLSEEQMFSMLVRCVTGLCHKYGANGIIREKTRLFILADTLFGPCLEDEAANDAHEPRPFTLLLVRHAMELCLKHKTTDITRVLGHYK